jgi:hypothetical protein
MGADRAAVTQPPESGEGTNVPAEAATVMPPASAAVAVGVLVVGLLVALVLTVGVGWRPGLLVFGGVLAVGALARAVLPASRAGVLGVRSRTGDTVFLAVLAVTVVVLAASLP